MQTKRTFTLARSHKLSHVLRLVAVGAVVALAAGVPGALGAGYAQVLSPQGRVVAHAGAATFDYPADGSLVHVGSADVDAGGATLTDVSLVGGIVHVGELDLLRDGRVLIDSVAAAGRLVTPRANTLVPLGPVGYVMLDQRARSKGRLGRVALRLVLQHAAFGSPAGTQVVVRLEPRARAEASATSYDPLAALGFSAVDARLIGFVPAPTDLSQTLGAKAVEIASHFLGVPYVWGGASPLTGFDCSGLVLYVYEQLGIHLTHYTGAQFTEGLRLPRDQLQPGDLVFFDDDPVLGPQHEGIYIGGGRFIQAPHTGDVVKVSSLDDPRYGFSYVGAVRPYDA
jgi:cell wall-associated NlpC family hydrolase